MSRLDRPPLSRGLPLLAALAVTAGPVTVRAQEACDAGRAGGAVAADLQWSGPLGRLVSIDARGIALRDALERVAAAAKLRISYSAERVPLDRKVCFSGNAVPAGAVLAELLAGTAVEAVVASENLVVLASTRSKTAPGMAADSVLPLDPVIVDAHPADPARRELPFVLGVLDGRQLAGQSSLSLGQALNAAVPGMWVWGGNSAGLPAQYGSVRGASSFGLSAPKVYIDGIEVANPLLLAHISPDAIERVEVIRGPQGAALYGADAIGGVTNIITRHDWVDEETPRFRIRSGFGFSNTDFPAGASLAQDHSLGLRLGSGARSATLHLTAGTSGDFIPGASSRHAGADGSLRFVGANSIITGTLRFLDERVGAPVSPLLADSLAAFAAAGAGNPISSTAGLLELRQYTAGLRAAWASGGRWTHTAVLGVDGYALAGLPGVFPTFQSLADSALRAAGTGALRGTVRMSSAARVDLGAQTAASVTITAEHTQFRQSADSGQVRAGVSRSSTGVSAQTDIALRERLFLTGGLRMEHNGTLETEGVSALPMIGGSWLAGAGPVGIKLRTAWGRGIRWPDLPAPTGSWEDVNEHFEHLQLGPEVQSGIEGGFDLSLGRALTVQVTRFDQTASGLVQRVATVETGSPREPRSPEYRPGSSLQSVGMIANRGWEMQASVNRGLLALSGTLSLVDSRVGRLADGYTGDLRAGDRMLGVPARTFSLSAAWTAPRWSASLTAARASDWINYDRIGLARASSTAGVYPAGAELRSYWLQYDGVPRLRAAFTRDIRRDLTLVFAADNLLDLQTGEPDNITVLPGRTLSLGFRASF